MGHAARRHESRRFNECSSIPADGLSPAGRARTGAAPRIKASAAPRAGRKRLHSVFQRGRGQGRGGEEREVRRRPPAAHTPPGWGWRSGALHRPLPKPEPAQKRSNQPPPLQNEAGNVGALHAGGTF